MNEVTAIGTAFMRIGKRARPSIVLVYAGLLMLIEGPHACTVTIRQLVKESGQCRHTVTRSLKFLEAAGVVEITRINGRALKCRHTLR